MALYKNLFLVHVDIMMQIYLEKTNLRPLGDVLDTVEYILIKSSFNYQYNYVLFTFFHSGSLADAKQVQSLKVLQLLVYTAAHEDAQLFLEMIFSTSAGKIVFDSYKDQTPLPEDIARANGHDELAKFLQDVNKR